MKGVVTAWGGVILVFILLVAAGVSYRLGVTYATMDAWCTVETIIEKEDKAVCPLYDQMGNNAVVRFLNQLSGVEK